MRKLSLTQLDRHYKNHYFLGRWCLYSNEQFDSDKLLKKVVPYTIGKKKFHESAKIKTEACYLKILPLISKVLNKKINNDYPVKFWEIIIGAWLRQYLDVLYERYETLINAKKYINEEVKVSLIKKNIESIAFNSNDFSSYLFNDKLNHQIYGQIIRARNIFNYNETINEEDVNIKLGRRKRNRLLIKVISAVSQLLAYKSQKIISNSYLDLKILLKGFLKGMWTPLYCPKYEDNGIKVDRLGRKLDFSLIKTHHNECNSVYEDLALELIECNLPIIFYEQLNNLLNRARKTLPKNMNVFITSNPNAIGELAKTWVALQKNNNSCKYFITQHGADYGQSDVITDEDVELSVCDKFLSTGWVSKQNQKIDNSIPVSRISGIGDFRNNKPPKKVNNNILMILASFPRYYYTGRSAPQGPAFANYLLNLSDLYKYLNEAARTRISCRSYTYEYGWNDKRYLKKNGYNFNSGRRKKLNNMMKKNALNIFTYNSTAILEAFAYNFISCCYWDPKQWSWRKEAQEDLKMLEMAGIYHSNIESLAIFLNKHKTSESLILWWSSKTVQNAKNKFCSKYAKSRNNEIKYWSKLLI